MKSSKIFILSILSVGVLLGCGKTQLRKTKGGLPYQVFRGNGDRTVKAGDFIKQSGFCLLVANLVAGTNRNHKRNH